MSGTERREPTEDEKLLAAISYFWILSLLVLSSKRENAYVAFHARQGMVLFIASVFLWIIPAIGLGLEVAILAAIFLGFQKALDGEKYPIPFIAELARRLGD